MAGLSVTTGAATAEEIACASEIAGAGYGHAQLWRGLIALVLGGLLAFVALRLAGANPTSVSPGVTVAFAVILGFVACTCGALAFVNISAACIGRQVSRGLHAMLAPVLKGGTITRVEVAAARVLTAEALDEDAPALVFVDGHGRGVYVNSAQLEELIELDDAGELSGATVPGHLMLGVSSEDGLILSLEASGARTRIVDGPVGDEGTSAYPFEPPDRPQEIAVLPREGTPEHWIAAMRD